MATAALLSTTVAPYVISAEEVTNKNSTTSTTNEAVTPTEQQPVTTTPDTGTIAVPIENTIDNQSEIIRSGGNTNTESIGNGTINSTTLTEVEAITQHTLTTPSLPAASKASSVDTTQVDVLWRQSITYTMQADPNDPMADFITGYLNSYFSNAEVVQVGNAFYVQMTLTGKAYGFETLKYIDANGTKQDIEVVSSTGDKLDQVRIIRVPLTQDDNGISKVFVDSGELGYGAYTLFFNFDLPALPAEPEQPTPEFNAKHVEKNVDFQFTAGADFETGAAMDSYFKKFVPSADLVLAEDGKAYAEITFGGHSYAIDTLKIGSAEGLDAEIISSTGSAETKDLVRVVRVALDEDYCADVFLGSAKGDYTFKFDLVEEETAFTFTSGTANDAYFSAWLPRADVVETAAGETYAYITLAGHSYAVDSILANGQSATIVSSTGSAETKDFVRVVRVQLDETNKVTLDLKAGTRGDYTFTFDFTKQTETPFIDTLTEEFQAVDLSITAGMPAMFIVPSVIASTQAKKVANGIAFSIQTTKADSVRGYYKTFIIKQNEAVVKQVSAETNEVAEFTVPSLEGLTVEVVYVTSSTNSETGEVTVIETTYAGTVSTAKLAIAKQPEQPATPDTSEIDFSHYIDGSDLDEAVFTEQAKKVTFTYQSLVAGIPSAQALAAIAHEASVKKVDGKYEVTLQINPKQTYDFFVAQKGVKIAEVDADGETPTTLTFTVESLDHLFFYVNGISGAASGSIETVIGAQVTGYTVLTDVEQPTVPEPTNPDAVPAFKETHAITLKFKNEDQAAPSLMDDYVNDSAILGITADGKKYVQMTVPTNYKGWITGFKSSVNGQLQESVIKENADGTTVYTFQLESFTANSAWVKIDIDSINYHHDYTVYLDFPNLETEYTELGETVTPKPEQPTTPPVVTPEPTPPAQESGTAITYSMVADPNGQMADFITGYLNPYFSDAKLVTKDGKKYVQLKLTGKAYGFTALNYIDASGTQKPGTILSSTGTGLDQVRYLEIPLIQNEDGVSKLFVDSGELGYGAYTLFFTFNVNAVDAPTAPSDSKNAIIKKPSDLKIEKNKPTRFTFNFGTTPLAAKVSSMIPEPTLVVMDTGEVKITFTITPQSGVRTLRILQNGRELGLWTPASPMARIASLMPFFAATSTNITFTTDSLEGISFEVVDTDGHTTELVSAVEIDKSLVQTETVTPTPPPGAGTVTGGGTAVVKPPTISTIGNVTNRESISYTMVSPGNDFITGYLAPYFSNAEVVTVDGKNYIELTLTGKAYGFATLTATGGGKIVSSEGEGMDQVRVFRFPAKKEVVLFVDSGSLGYGSYNLNFVFNLSEEQLSKAAEAGQGGITAVQTLTPQIISEGDVKFTIPAESSAIVAYAKKLSAKLVNSKYTVDLTLAINTDLDTFVVKQGEKEIANWDKSQKGITSSNVTTDVLSFTVDSLEDLTFIATTKNRTLTAKVGAEIAKKEEGQVAKDDRQTMSYTMQADPNGPMADFITGYLAPYFSDAVYVKENGKEFVEMTLTGKAYGFATLQYIDETGKNVAIDVVSSKGEKLDQVRVIRLPLVQDKDGVTKLFVDSGDLGYGAYTLFFKFNVPTESITSSNETAANTVNPFKDINDVYSKEDIITLFHAGITTGTTDTTFSPNASMTRAQFAVMVARALDVTSAKETQFKDVQGKWYAAEVQALFELGIITGVSDTKFKPGDKITRQQAAVMIHRLMQHKGYTNTATSSALNFTDSAKVADYAKEAVAELQAQGIMTGYNGKVNPKNNLTRAQMAKILKNAADLVGLLK